MSHKIAIRTARAPKPAADYGQGVPTRTTLYAGLAEGLLAEIDALAVVG